MLMIISIENDIYNQTIMSCRGRGRGGVRISLLPSIESHKLYFRLSLAVTIKVYFCTWSLAIQIQVWASWFLQFSSIQASLCFYISRVLGIIECQGKASTLIKYSFVKYLPTGTFLTDSLCFMNAFPAVRQGMHTIVCSCCKPSFKQLVRAECVRCP